MRRGCSKKQLSGLEAFPCLFPILEGGGGGVMSKLAVCEILRGVEGAGQDRRGATLDDFWDSSQSGSPGEQGSVEEFLRGLLETSHKGEVKGSSEETGEVTAVSPGFFGVVTALPCHFGASSLA